MPLAPPPPIPAAVMASGGQERALVRAINVQRRDRGLPRLRLTVSLSRAARAQSRTVLRRDQLTHAGMAARMSRHGARFRVRGETLAWVPRGRPSSARAVVRMWMGSPSHRATLMSPSFRRIGIGRAHGTMGAAGRGVAITADLGSLR